MLYLKSLAIDDCPELSRRGRCVPLNDGIVRKEKYRPVSPRSDKCFRLQFRLSLLSPIVVVGGVVDEMLSVPNIETPYLLRQRCKRLNGLFLQVGERDLFRETVLSVRISQKCHAARVRQPTPFMNDGPLLTGKIE